MVDMKFAAAVAVAAFVRLQLFWWGYDSILSDRVEFSTALTSWKRLFGAVRECEFLEFTGLSPYAGYLCHHPPLVRMFFFLPLMLHLEVGFFIAMDVVAAFVLRNVARLYFATDEGKNCRYTVPGWAPDLIAVIYLFNPVTIATCVSKSTAILETVSTLLALMFGLQDNMFASTACLALSSYISLYPIQLMVPIALMLKKQSRMTACVMLLLYVGGLVHASFETSGRTWDWVEGSYAVILNVTDLSPNLGLFWYFFQEVFTHFRPLFCVVLQVHCFFYLAPMTICVKDRPVVLFWLIITVLATVKPYTSMADLSLEFALLPLFFPLINGFFPRAIAVSLVFIFVLPFLMPLAWYSWIYQGSGNANFYYGMTLAIAFAQIALLSEMLHAVMEDKYRHKHKIDHYANCPCPVEGGKTAVADLEKKEQ